MQPFSYTFYQLVVNYRPFIDMMEEHVKRLHHNGLLEQSMKLIKMNIHVLSSVS